MPDEAIQQCVKIVNDRIHTSPELTQTPVDPFRVQIITTDQLRPRSRKLIRAVSDTQDKFIARVFNTSDSEDTYLDYTVKVEQPEAITVKQSPMSIIKTYEIPDRTYDIINNQRKRIASIRQRGQKGVPVTIINPVMKRDESGQTQQLTKESSKQ